MTVSSATSSRHSAHAEAPQNGPVLVTTAVTLHLMWILRHRPCSTASNSPGPAMNSLGTVRSMVLQHSWCVALRCQESRWAVAKQIHQGSAARYRQSSNSSAGQPGTLQFSVHFVCISISPVTELCPGAAQAQVPVSYRQTWSLLAGKIWGSQKVPTCSVQAGLGPPQGDDPLPSRHTHQVLEGAPAARGPG